MLYIKFNADNQAINVVARTDVDHRDTSIRTRNDWSSYAEVVAIADALTAALGRKYLGVDAGNHVSPRFDVVEAPAVGDDVSKTFNGDSYPCGKVARIVGDYKTIVTDGGLRFNRRRLSGAFIEGGTWGLVGGHRDERNPSF